jgi:hypothetical protein
MTMAQAIAVAEGLDRCAKWNDVRLLRYYGKDTVKRHRVNMSGALLAQEPNFLVLPGDVVYCRTSTIADIHDFVGLYIKRLLPIAITGAALPVPGGGQWSLQKTFRLAQSFRGLVRRTHIGPRARAHVGNRKVPPPFHRTLERRSCRQADLPGSSLEWQWREPSTFSLPKKPGASLFVG